ncbi:MAG: HD domain-containing protein [Bacteroidales bacterium]
MEKPTFNPGEFKLHQSHFESKSALHGIKHTYRVMCHVLVLGNKMKWERETRLAFCAAFIHDMSRIHDGYCTNHGLWAAQHKLPLFTEFFKSQGINNYEIEEIGVAVQNHSERFELEKDHKFRKTTALLKDADALDRIRLGENNLDPSYLRLSYTKGMIPFARDLYFASETREINDFNDILKLAESIMNRNVLK